MSNDQTPISIPLFIGGEPRTTTETLTIADPGKPGRTVGEAAAASAQDVEDAIAAADAAFPAWSALTGPERAARMAEAIQGIGDDRDADAAILSQENGKIVHEAWVDALVFELRWNLALAHAEEVDGSETLEPVAGAIPNRTLITYRPMGVVTIIVPFNWPIAILGAALPHALLAGNTVIVKPPLTAPLATARVVQRVAAKLPPGVLQVVTGRDADMSPLIEDERIAKVSFTGSVGGGKRMMEMASRTVTPVTLELGGNDAAVFLEDAILDDEHLDRLFAAVYDTTGQICMNAKRVLVHRSRLDELVAGLEARLRGVRLGYGLDEGTTMGPLHAPSQKSFVEGLIQEAKDAGADVREFGELPADPELAGGNFVRPAVVVGADPALRVVTEEQFGPVIPVLAFDDEEEAVRLANDTWAGLGNSVWTADADAAARVGARLRSGYVWVNDHGATRLDLRAPFGGVKQSGIGREQGLHGVRDFQEPHAISTLVP
ncbi:aldehyde dehydrogenase family protein [Leucobacter allii]|uniref:aldehyde dehydrogenase family protein n=1 Tax=Leucobacter allii TaxID=2932247 RepID=UPI001FD463AE|nr:aldehyde dehydrogenase family protein [Leucobacter allii]UOR01845.1 aldehyde dehydrogenase family protein [Leucobacter allii]